MKQVLVVDDEPGMRAALRASFTHHGWQVDTAGGGLEAIAHFRAGRHPLVVTDIRMPDGDGLALLREVRALAPHTAVILLTAFGSVPDAVAAMKDGACDYLVKPVAFEPLEKAVRRILERVRPGERAGGELVGGSEVWLRAMGRARQVAGSDADILIQAESGTGKELVARMIHRLSPRRDRPFVAINCAAFPETLLESELFGHAKGAFTGAACAKAGKFELANGGTLLLDEVGEMPLSLQPKLLRALQEREFDRLGDTRAVKVNIRVIATTNRSLAGMIQEGLFRADLYYRLNVIPLSLPPLRARREDVAQLAHHFVNLYAPPGSNPRLHPELLSRLEQHSWPGNVRELANLMRRAVALSGAELGIDILDPREMDPIEMDPREMDPRAMHPRATDPIEPAGKPMHAQEMHPAGMQNAAASGTTVAAGDRLRPGLSLEDMEKRLFEVTLDATQGNRSRAAELLGVSLRTVRNKIRGYGLPARRSYGNGDAGVHADVHGNLHGNSQANAHD